MTVSLSGHPVTLGRRSDNDVVVDETTVSRRHALILETPDGFFLRDLSTTNGTYVNRDKIGHQEHKLKHGDRIRLAGSEVTFIFREEGAGTIRMSTESPATGITDIGSLRQEAEARAIAEARALEATADQPHPEVEPPPDLKQEETKPALLGKDSDLFRLLQSKTGSVVTREEIARLLWPELIEAGLADQVIDQSVERLRVHIEDDPLRPVHLITAGEIGFLLI